MLVAGPAFKPFAGRGGLSDLGQQGWSGRRTAAFVI
jgi:hypothetical protein